MVGRIEFVVVRTNNNLEKVTGLFLHIISSVIHRSHFIAEGSVFQISFPLEEKYEIELLRSVAFIKISRLHCV
jgi:hypothetical protein